MSPDRSLGPYQLVEKIGTGGTGDIYLAVRRGPGNFAKPLAVKVLRGSLTHDEESLRAFIGEAQIAASMNHPNIVQVFDVGEHQGRFFIAMELVRGVTLRALMDSLRAKGERLSPEVLVYLARELLEGVHHVHEQVDETGAPLNLVHRDVTPNNVLLSLDGRVKLTDFGIAKAPDLGLGGETLPGTVKGTLEYLSPEQVTLKPADRRSDLFAAAVTLHFASTGESPFWRGRLEPTIISIARDPLPDLFVKRADLPKALITAIHRAAEKVPEQRYQTARAFAEALPKVDASRCAGELAAHVSALYKGPRHFSLPRSIEISTPPRRSLDAIPTLALAGPSLPGVRNPLAKPAPPAPRVAPRLRLRLGHRHLAFGAAGLAVLLVSGLLVSLALHQPGKPAAPTAESPTEAVAATPSPLPEVSVEPVVLSRSRSDEFTEVTKSSPPRPKLKGDKAKRRHDAKSRGKRTARAKEHRRRG